MAGFEPESIDAIVTDPPAGISFMGKAWDHDKGGRDQWIAWMTGVMEQCYRVLKPGGHILVWALPRTSHWTGMAIEDAGFEVRDKILHCFAQGFPKGLDVSKAIDKAAGAEREQTGSRPKTGAFGGVAYAQDDWTLGQSGQPLSLPITTPATPEGVKWAGWNVALKPAYEDLWFARKPLGGRTVAANVLEYGTGAINIDATRIPIGAEDDIHAKNPHTVGTIGANGIYGAGEPTLYEVAKGRWPSNLILTDPIFDGDVEGVVGGGAAKSTGNGHGAIPASEGWSAPGYGGEFNQGPLYDDSGTYSRYFLIPKASRSDREPIMDIAMESAFAPTMGNGIGGREHDPEDRGPYRVNDHPTTKPTELTRHLLPLVTPPGGVCLDPFAGSGTTGLACQMEGFDWIMIEKEAEYVAIAEARLNGAPRGMGLSPKIDCAKSLRRR